MVPSCCVFISEYLARVKSILRYTQINKDKKKKCLLAKDSKKTLAFKHFFPSFECGLVFLWYFNCSAITSTEDKLSFGVKHKNTIESCYTYYKQCFKGEWLLRYL